jgi:glycyl-tRNA synthetase beta chain
VSLPFLLEIGVEEIPDWMIPPALDQLRSLFQDVLRSCNLGADSVAVSVDATPRRLVLRAENLPEGQPDVQDLVSGPPASAAFNNGEPTQAALGFARKMGVAVADLETQATARGEYLVFRRKVPGRQTRDILASALPEMVLKIHFPKTMYWTGKAGPRFIRPIRWLVAVLGDEVVPFELAGVKAGRATDGHRLLGSRGVAVSPATYDRVLRENAVLVPAEARARRIENGIRQLLDGTGLRLKPDPALLDTLVYITEIPTPLLGSFDPEYLKLPEEVLVTVMRHHQKYFSVEDSEGRLAPHFIAVMNTAADPEGLVRRGNERVLRARFNDARFFWSVDQQRRLEDRLEDLAHVTFQAKLGSYLEKTKRVARLARKLARMAGADAETAARAALLAKCDLTTEMVKELTELQGIVGGLYAREQGEPEPVWRAIYEHYKPLGMEDSIPATEAGRLVSLADKLDTLEGSFGLGMIPSGSRDPFALRRAAQGVVKILVEGRLPLSLPKLIGKDPQLTEFFLDRIRYYFRDVRGFLYDEVNAVLASGHSNLTGVEARLEAIRTVRPTENFEPLAASFKRIKNILRQAEFAGDGEVNVELLETGPEADLYAAANGVARKVRRHRKTGDYRAALEAIASLRPRVDLFFDKVLVNAPDPRIRENRLTLLHNLLREFSAIADFSEIVTTQ